MAQKTLTQLYASHTGKVSDKWSSYLVEYDQLFSPYRNKAINLLEIGIQNGGSIEIWAKYFKRAKTIIGCDINPDCASLKYDDTRISVVVGDANSTKTYQEITNLSPTFDLLIDDGSHTSSDIIKSFIHYFPHINNNGLFVAEDLHCSYWQLYEGGLYDPYSSISFFKLLADVINHEHWGVDKQNSDLFNGFVKKYQLGKLDYVFAQVHSVTFINSICVIRKSSMKNNLLQQRFISGIDEKIEQGIYKLHGTLAKAKQQSSNPSTKRQLMPYEELPIVLKEISKQAETISILGNELSEQKIIESSLLKKIEELSNNEIQLKQKNKATNLKLKKTLKNLNNNSSQLETIKSENSNLISQAKQAENLFTEILTNKDKQKVLNKIVPKFTLGCLFSKSKRRLLKDKRQILESGLFSPLYYLTHNPDVAKANVNPLNHFLKFGWKEGRNPSERFDCSYYLKTNKDVKHAQVNPLIHYLKNGKQEGRSPRKSLQKNELALFGPNTSEIIKKYFNPTQKGVMSTNRYLNLYGTLFPNKEISDKEDEYQVLGIKAQLIEHHLIAWNKEKRKQRIEDLVSIIILAYGQSKLTDNCLKSILGCNAGIKYEIILINNSQQKSDITSIEKWAEHPQIKIVHNPENLNFALGCNQGFAKSIGNNIVFLNNDTTVTEQWLFKLIDPLQNPNISLTQPRLLYPDGSLQCMGLVFSNKSNLAYPIYQGQPPSSLINRNRLFLAVTGACFGIRAEDFSLVQGFDISFINGQEDIDFCLRLNKMKGSQALYVHDSIVYHYEGKSSGRGKFVINNRKKFLKKYKEKISADDHHHYKNDHTVINKWELDSTDFKKLNVENYIPSVSIKNISRISTPVIKEEFFISGKLSQIPSNKTIIVAAHVVSQELFGGERSFLDMVDAIDKSQYNTLVILPDNKNKKYIELLKEISIGIYFVTYRMWSSIGENKKAIDLLSTIYVRNKVDLVYANTIMCREPLSAAKELNIQTIIHVREAILYDPSLAEKIPLTNTEDILSEVSSSSDFLVMNSKFTNGMFNTDHSAILYNKIDTPSFNQLKNTIKNKKIIFGLISSNIPKKGILDLIKIAKICLEKSPSAQFLLIGPENQNTKKIKKIIKQQKLSNLKIAGYFESPIAAIEQCNVILNLSHFAESFGRTVGEALAGGRPVIAYKYGAIPELIENNKNGFLVEYKDTLGVTDSIKKLCDEPTLISKMGEHGRKSISKLSSPVIYRENLNSILSSRLKHNMDLMPDITIIIPIFNAYKEVVNCIDSVINTTAHLNIKILLLNDASTDNRIQKVLSKYGKMKVIEVIHNEKNKGYTKTINLGINLANTNDVILLNSDTVVTLGWVESLSKNAYLNKNTGTVTAMSDNAGAFSFPIQGVPNPKPETMPYHNYVDIITIATDGIPPVEVPTGSGFCMFIKRALFDDIGYFDDILFPRGYGEENDFCMRAITSGWTNIISPNTFVFHVRTASFGSEKEKLVNEAIKKVTKRHPSYLKDVKAGFNSPDMNKLRNSIKEGLKKLDRIRG